MNLLIVNDEELTAETMRSEMNWPKYGIDEVYTAYDTIQAKDVIGQKTVDILLCDIEMPGDNGIELLRWVRREKLPIECIFLTCHPSFEYAKEAISLDCQDYILIPAQYEDIGAGIKKVVDRIRAARQDAQYVEYGKRVVQQQIEEAAEAHGMKKSGKELAKEIETYVLKNLGSEELSVNEMANDFFMHPVYMNRVFKKETGVSISQFIVSERMKLAAQLIRSGNLSLYSIAEQVGYKGYPIFCNAFKKYYGCNPSDYLKKS